MCLPISSLCVVLMLFTTHDTQRNDLAQCARIASLTRTHKPEGALVQNYKGAVGEGGKRREEGEG